jgi:hypothetical protein
MNLGRVAMKSKFQATTISLAILTLFVGFAFAGYGILHREGAYNYENTYYLNQ